MKADSLGEREEPEKMFICLQNVSHDVRLDRD